MTAPGGDKNQGSTVGRNRGVGQGSSQYGERTPGPVADHRSGRSTPAAQQGHFARACRCRNLADEAMPPSVRIGDAEARRRGLMDTKDCPTHAAEATSR